MSIHPPFHAALRRALVALVFLCALSIPGLGQANAPILVTRVGSGFHFEGLEYREGVLAGYVPLPRIQVTVFQYNPTFVLVGETDSAGNINSPLFDPFGYGTVSIEGPQNSGTIVSRVTIANGIHQRSSSASSWWFFSTDVLPQYQNIAQEEVNAFRGIDEARLLLSEYMQVNLAFPLHVDFTPEFEDPPGSGTCWHAEYDDNRQTVSLGCLETLPAPGLRVPVVGTSLAARHRSILAHEVTHAFQYRLWFKTPATEPMWEAIADYYGAVIAETPIIGAGVVSGSMPRWVWNLTMFPNPDPIPNNVGKPTSGGLYQLRQFLRLTSPSNALPEYRLAAVMSRHPWSELDLVRELLKLDDNDQDLTNGTPHRAQHFLALHLLHNLPWPPEAPFGIYWVTNQQNRNNASSASPGQ